MDKERIINQYFERLNIKKFNDFDSFIEYIESNYDPLLFQQIIDNLLKRFDEKKDELFKVKNSNLSLSLDFISWSSDFYKKIFRDMLSMDLKKNVLDIGCDNGFITCFLAYSFRNTNFIGIDINPYSIKIAKELAKELNLKNIKFYTIDYIDIISQFSSSYFDTVISIKVLHEIDSKEDYADIAYKLLKNNGLLYSCERLIDEEDLKEWVNLLDKSNFFIYKPIPYISFNELDFYMEFPIIYARK
ncbi:methyltransferase domain-containing protein [Clostridium sp. D2Q-11]|uniref:Methyltransferase domain-containing protein n=1 Tax=Anaeromonas frigoriresistens TaxID=2683708 RepID=A0A942UV09_9FIRM|nr:class I SAM-dependent methyltransferase [Anaeromonas frigoriresistens]MBS4539098.1 methyltransferase domain-containing protein [Anaeromonas frigoriresistens]